MQIVSRCFFLFYVVLIGCAAALPVPTESKVIKIACIGDSITYGAGMFNREMNAYPKQVQAMLGDGYLVKNFGVNGNTLLKKGDNPYWKSEQYKNALAFSPDIVFIKLGTNDSKKQNRLYLDSDFVQDYKDLITSFKVNNKEVRVVLLLPVPSFMTDSTSIWNPIIKDKIIPLIQKVAYDTQSEIIDLYQLFVGESHLFPDTIHPSSLGATRLAKRVYEAVVQKTNTNNELLSEVLNTKVKQGNFYGFQQIDFKLKGVACKLVKPKMTAKGSPWVLRARFWGHEPQTDIALLERGFHIAYCDVANLFGADEAVNRWNDFYAAMTKAGLAKKVVLEGMSRGGLIMYNWAVENPEKVACIYADAPVLDGKSWPGGLEKGKGSPADWEKFKKVYVLSSDQKIADFTGNPIQNTVAIGTAGFPMLHIFGEADTVVPANENTVPFAKQIIDAGGNITLVPKPGIGHHPHSFKNPTAIVDFILRATKRKINFASIPAPGSEYRSAAGWSKGKGWWAQAADIDSLCENSAKVDLLLIGNSITQGFGGNRPNVTYAPGELAVNTYFKELKIIGAGISGDRTQHIAWRLKNGHYENCNPDFVVLTIGVNNFWDNTAVEIAQGIEVDLELLQERLPKSTILFFGPLPTGLLKDATQRIKYNEVHRLIAQLGSKKQVYYYNMVNDFSDEKGNLNRAYYGNDGIHLKPEGYTAWAKFIAHQMQVLK